MVHYAARCFLAACRDVCLPRDGRFLMPRLRWRRVVVLFLEAVASEADESFVVSSCTPAVCHWSAASWALLSAIACCMAAMTEVTTGRPVGRSITLQEPVLLLPLLLPLLDELSEPERRRPLALVLDLLPDDDCLFLELVAPERRCFNDEDDEDAAPCVVRRLLLLLLLFLWLLVVDAVAGAGAGAAAAVAAD